ncbi:MAG: methyl-accepting chemotaxis protein [Burkholderiaceae bacterium]
MRREWHIAYQKVYPAFCVRSNLLWKNTVRLNTPVSNIEYELSDTETIVSTTNLKGIITYANPYFIQVSGFSEAELIGAPQNILRHPDMPVEAFADFWATIKDHQSWTGMVKNRCKNGDFYWVLANVTPVFEDGCPVGYMSVRTKPSRAQVSEATMLYQKIKNGNPDRIALKNGISIRTGALARLAAFKNISIEKRIGWNLSFLIFVLVALMVANVFLDGAVQGGGRVWLNALSVTAIVSALYFWYSLYDAMITPLKQILKISKIMAGGDLTQKISRTSRKDDIGQLLGALRQLNVNLHSIVGDVRSNSEQISVATREIAAGNMDLSGRTESQASALEETASSMEELASTVQQNTDNALHANEMADSASVVAGQGGAVVSRVVATMAEISGASKKIVDIISIIEGIAFQTNILALNAAVEAARAGEQGRGFAVVATEVRSLAQRSATAAKEIKQLIDASVEKIEAGTVLAEHAGTTMQKIIESVQGVSIIMSEISAASREQSSGIAQVNIAVTQMDEVTQQNAALVEQAAAAAASLQDQTVNLVQALTVFKLDRKRQA